MTRLTHLDDSGAAHMVDVSAKDSAVREAVAEAVIVLSPEAYDAAISGNAPKGDVLATARIAGIMAAKKTSELIPLCHPLALSKAGVEFEPLTDRHALRIIASVKTIGPTGVEMEALTAASIAALTVYDMIKAIDRSAVIEAVRLVEKSGGKSGSYKAARDIPRSTARMPAASRVKPSTLMHETNAPKATAAAAPSQREAFRAFMVARRLRATEWASKAGVPAAQIYAFLTGKSRALSQETAERLARAANVRVEDMLR